jgi:parallel beta-helix repeat protein
MHRHNMTWVIGLMILTNWPAGRTLGQACAADPGFTPAVTISTPTTTSSLGVSSWTGTTVHLEADLTVDGTSGGGTTFIIQNTEVRLDPGVRIIVQSDYSLRVASSTLTDCDNAMWETVEVEPRGECVVTASMIEHAVTAITSRASTSTDVAYFEVVNSSQLLNNYIGVAVESHEAFHTGIVEDSEIAAPSLIAPRAGEVGFAGMAIEDVELGINIGDITGAYGDGSGTFNHFHDLNFGVYLVDAKAFIQNNLFEDMVADASPNYGIGVGAERTLSTKRPFTVGDDNTSAGIANNLFRDCRIGIFGLSVGVAGIFQNDFEGSGSSVLDATMEAGIWLQTCTGTHAIVRNAMEEFLDFGIYVRNNTGQVQVEDNVLENVNILTNPTDRTNAIQLRNLTAPQPSIVTNNTIAGVPVGIAAISPDPAEITGNDITIRKPNPTANNNFGIVGIGHDVGTISENVINVTYCATCTTNTQTRGIYLDASAGVLVDFNDIYDTEAGIFLEGTCSGTNLRCNRINDCTYGFQLDGMVLGAADLGPINGPSGGTTPADNQWYPTTTANRSFASSSSDANAIQWFYRNTPSQYSMIPIAALNTDDAVGPVTSLVPINDNTGAACSYFRADGTGDWTSAALRDHQYGALRDYLDTEGLGCHTLMHQMAYDARAMDSSLFVGDGSDAAWQLLLDNIHAGWVDEFRLAKLAWKEGESAEASLLLAGIAPTCAQDAYLAYALDRYWARFPEVGSMRTLTPTFPFSSSEYAQLESIAALTLAEGGHGTLTARALTDWMPSSDSHVSLSKEGEASSPQRGVMLSVYPNPADQIVSIEGLSLQAKEWQVIALDGTAHAINGEIRDDRLTLRVSDLPPGLYSVIVRSAEGHTDRVSFVKTR